MKQGCIFSFFLFLLAFKKGLKKLPKGNAQISSLTITSFHFWTKINDFYVYF